MRVKKVRRALAAALCGAMLVSMGMMASAAEDEYFFNAAYYASTNPDVVAAVGTGEDALYQHYVMYGKAEGRDGGGIFDPQVYAEAYPDVAAVYGNDAKALYNHFMTNGLAEGRTEGLDFNEVCYLALNPDLKAAYGTDKASLFQQYVNEGAAQGRKGIHTDRANKWFCDKKGEHLVVKWNVEYYTTCVDSGIQRGYCEICGERETHIDPPDGYSHIDKDGNDRCDLCSARLNAYARR